MNAKQEKEKLAKKIYETERQIVLGEARAIYKSRPIVLARCALRHNNAFPTPQQLRDESCKYGSMLRGDTQWTTGNNQHDYAYVKSYMCFKYPHVYEKLFDVRNEQIVLGLCERFAAHSTKNDVDKFLEAGKLCYHLDTPIANTGEEPWGFQVMPSPKARLGHFGLPVRATLPVRNIDGKTWGPLQLGAVLCPSKDVTTIYGVHGPSDSEFWGTFKEGDGAGKFNLELVKTIDHEDIAQILIFEQCPELNDTALTGSK